MAILNRKIHYKWPFLIAILILPEGIIYWLVREVLRYSCWWTWVEVQGGQEEKSPTPEITEHRQNTTESMVDDPGIKLHIFGTKQWGFLMDDGITESEFVGHKLVINWSSITIDHVLIIFESICKSWCSRSSLASTHLVLFHTTMHLVWDD